MYLKVSNFEDWDKSDSLFDWSVFQFQSQSIENNNSECGLIIQPRKIEWQYDVRVFNPFNISVSYKIRSVENLSNIIVRMEDGIK